MSLACLVCHGVESPSHSFRSHSISSSDNDGGCCSIANCLSRKVSSIPHSAVHSSIPSSSKVNPHPATMNNDISGPPRLVRSHAVRRDVMRDWNFDEIPVGH